MKIKKEKIIQLREQGLSYGSIAKMVKLSRARIHQICSGYHSPAYDIKHRPKKVILREFILKRDNFKCQWGIICGDYGYKNIKVKDLVVHHIDFNDENNNPNNLIILCKFCHAGFHATNHIKKKFEKNLGMTIEKREKQKLRIKVAQQNKINKQ